MTELPNLFLAIALSLSGAPADCPAANSMQPADPAVLLELEAQSTVTESILGEDPVLADFVRRLA